MMNKITIMLLLTIACGANADSSEGNEPPSIPVKFVSFILAMAISSRLTYKISKVLQQYSFYFGNVQKKERYKLEYCLGKFFGLKSNNDEYLRKVFIAPAAFVGLTYCIYHFINRSYCKFKKRSKIAIESNNAK
jgi:hypothetical protein